MLVFLTAWDCNVHPCLSPHLQEHPVVITKFIRGAREVEVDAVAKTGKVSESLSGTLGLQCH